MTFPLVAVFWCNLYNGSRTFLFNQTAFSHNYFPDIKAEALPGAGPVCPVRLPDRLCQVITKSYILRRFFIFEKPNGAICTISEPLNYMI